MVFIFGPPNEIEVRGRRKINDAAAGTKLEEELTAHLTKLQEAGKEPSSICICDLDISQNKCPIAQLEALFDVLIVSVVRVQRLKLFGCPTVTDDVARKIAEWLGSVTAETAPAELHLSDCSITAVGFGLIIDAIQENAAFPIVNETTKKSTPLYLRLENNYIEESAIQEKVTEKVIKLFAKSWGTSVQSLTGSEKVYLLKRSAQGGFQQKKGTPPPPETVAADRKEVNEVWKPEWQQKNSQNSQWQPSWQDMQLLEQQLVEELLWGSDAATWGSNAQTWGSNASTWSSWSSPRASPVKPTVPKANLPAPAKKASPAAPVKVLPKNGATITPVKIPPKGGSGAQGAGGTWQLGTALPAAGKGIGKAAPAAGKGVGKAAPKLVGATVVSPAAKLAAAKAAPKAWGQASIPKAGASTITPKVGAARSAADRSRTPAGRQSQPNQPKKKPPHPWEEQFSEEFGIPYFWNPVTQESLWEMPSY